MKRTYLGDELYASDDGYQIYLIAARDGIEHFVALDGETLYEFFQYVERQRKVKITVKHTHENN